MIPTIKYILITLKHKWYVLYIGLKLKVPIYLLLLHDLSKFNIFKETRFYGNQFFGKKDNKLGFDYAWNHHQKHNKHHWEYWTMPGKTLPMPDKYIKEMIADWFGASKAYEGHWPKSLESWDWFNKNFTKIKLHNNTREQVLNYLNGYFKK